MSEANVYVGRKDSDQVVAAALIWGRKKEELAKEVALWIAGGLTVDRIALEDLPAQFKAPVRYAKDGDEGDDELHKEQEQMDRLPGIDDKRSEAAPSTGDQPPAELPLSQAPVHTEMVGDEQVIVRDDTQERFPVKIWEAMLADEANAKASANHNGDGQHEEIPGIPVGEGEVVKSSAESQPSEADHETELLSPELPLTTIADAQPA